MTQDLQYLLEKINADGVEKANAEAEKIIGAANVRAKAILDAATREAGKTLAAAKQESEAFERRAEETIRQSARDTLLMVEQSVTALLTNLLLKEVNAAMSNPDLIATLATEAVRAYIAGKADAMTVTASEELANVLRVKLADMAKRGVKVETDERAGAGFKIRLAGRVEHDFSGTAVATALARGLRPRLAALLK